MATIEPRLIHLLNESTTPQLLHNDLPPLHTLPLPKSSDRSLPPLEPDASHRDRSGTDGQTVLNTVAPLYLVGDESSIDYRKDGIHSDGKYAGTSAAFPLRLLLGETDVTEPNNSLSKILDDTPDSVDEAGNKKRHRGLQLKEDFVQLPQPMKKQKAAQKAPAMPPIINGLHEPPPHAALFPPISSSSFPDNDTTQIKIIQEFTHVFEDKTTTLGSEAEKNANKVRKRATKPRRKWSEEETNHLLLGVNRHGVGKWTSILEDTEFRFNERTAGDLKDRFRTCCPDELRRSNKAAQLHLVPMVRRETKQKSKTDTHLEKILIDEERQTPATDYSAEQEFDNDTNPRQKKSRAHRKKMEDLVELGIHGPFKKSHRRERRPFTEHDDREILDGLEQYGPAWTKIQRDPRFHLAERQPTDLRDRVRNKYPGMYQRIEKGTFPLQEGGRGNDIMEPSITMSISNSLKPSNPNNPELQMDRTTSREDLPRWPLHILDTTDIPHSGQGFDFGETPVPQFIGGEMDISRLLLDDTRLSQPNTRIMIEGALASSPSTTDAEYRRDHEGQNVRSKAAKRSQLPGSKKHQKRLSAPSHWLLDKLSGTYAPKPSAGPHKLRDCMPLVVFIRNRLKYALNYREVKAILMQRLVKVDGKVRTDVTYPTGFMDVITIEKTGENFRLVYDTKGRFTVHRIQTEEAEYKLGKVKRVQLGRGGIPFLVTHDARTIRYPDPSIKVNDTVKIDLATGKITDFIKFDTGAVAMVTGGRNMGRVGVITHRERHDGGFNIVHIKDAIDNSFATRESNVFVVGQEKPWISLPKGKGVKLTIAEERDRRRAYTIGH
ncbi:hypothetical protein G7046_g4671 [Stylonectria norvegica]|nr:hypothetical protein G7046_g4671 [Stylonectria norvegica]